MDRFAVRRTVLDSPGDAALRLAYARGLLEADHRAAAWHEVLVARQLGAAAPVDLLASFTFENPVGVAWSLGLVAVSPGAVAPADVPDPRFPGAFATSGSRTLPLLLLLGRACTECDENGTAVCTDCGGSGWKPSLLGDDEVSCPARDTCNRCGGSKYLVNVYRAVRSACPHVEAAPEAEGPTWKLGRCTACGLGAMSAFPLWTDLWACGGCGLFDCRCSPD